MEKYCDNNDIDEEDTLTEETPTENLEEVDLVKFKRIYEKMEDQKKWILSSGKVVEDELYKFGIRCKHEQ